MELRAGIADVMKRYILHIMQEIEEGKINYDPPQELVEEMLNIADFACRARSPVHKDFKSGQIDSHPDLEMPGRVTKQLLAMAGAFMAMNQCAEGAGMKKGKGASDAITMHQRRVIYRCAFDSIPSMRRATMRLLAKYSLGVNTTAAATYLKLPSDSVKKYLYELNALGICERKAESGNKGHKWTMTDPEHRRVVCLLEGVQSKEEELVQESNDDGEEISLDPEDDLARRAAIESFDAMPDGRTAEDFK